MVLDIRLLQQVQAFYKAQLTSPHHLQQPQTWSCQCSENTWRLHRDFPWLKQSASIKRHGPGHFAWTSTKKLPKEQDAEREVDLLEGWHLSTLLALSTFDLGLWLVFSNSNGRLRALGKCD